MLMTADIPAPPAPSAAAVVIDENWAARTATPPPVAAARPATVDPRIAAGVAAVLAEAPAPEQAANRQPRMQGAAYGTDAAAVDQFARRFSEARKPACLSPATGGLGLFAIPVIAVQALRGKCSMP